MLFPRNGPDSLIRLLQHFWDDNRDCFHCQYFDRSTVALKQQKEYHFSLGSLDVVVLSVRRRNLMAKRHCASKMQSGDTRKSEPKAPSSLACIPCRHRHLKCDAAMPVCTRCQNMETQCTYVRSRRGMRPKKPQGPVSTASPVSPSLTAASEFELPGEIPGDPLLLQNMGMDGISADWLLGEVPLAPTDEVC